MRYESVINAFDGQLTWMKEAF